MKQRQVSIELLRIIAMIMVLMLHVNFICVGAPTVDTILTTDGIIRTLLQSLSICAVDTFVMISGWFKIKPSLRGFCNFMWQVIYVVGVLLIVGVLFFNIPITYKTIFMMFGLYGGGGWFVASYIGLYFIAPILNAYIENTETRKIMMTLALFFAFEFIWGNTLSVEFVVGGYSTFSFIGIYTLAGCLRKMNITVSRKISLGIFCLSIIINATLYIIAVRFDFVVIRDILFNYISPLVIIEAASLLLTFTPPYPKELYCKELYSGLHRLVSRHIFYMSVQDMLLKCIAMESEKYTHHSRVLRYSF